MKRSRAGHVAVAVHVNDNDHGLVAGAGPGDWSQPPDFIVE